jgi:cell division transport system permease protein
MAMRRKILGNYPYVSVIFTITMALFLIGLFGILSVFANKLSILIKENIEIHVYMDHNLDDNTYIKIKKFLETQPYINSHENKKLIKFITKEEAAKKLIKETGEEFIKFLGENPLRDAYVLRIHPDYSNKSTMRLIKIQLEKIEGVYEVVYIESIVDSINKNIARISLVLIGFSLILIIVVFILINSSIKLALYSQRFLIRSMQLVGATSTFIKLPFLLRSILYGIIGGIFAIILLYSLLQYTYTHIPELKLLENQKHLAILAISIISFGSFLGFTSSLFAINKYLKMSLDELV